MRNKIIGLIGVILFLVGILIFNYPVISTLYNQLHQGSVMADYDETLAKMQQEELDAYRQEAVEYNGRLAAAGGQAIQDAFSEGESKRDSEYDGVLDMEKSGVMGAVEIPKINVYLPIYHGTSHDVLNVGVGHLMGSSMPVGGGDTHSVLTGHRGLPTAELFTNLDQLGNGDEFYIHILKETLAYRVYDIETVLPEEVSSLSVEKGRDIVTLVTCTPYGINSHRLFIHAARTDYAGEEREQSAIRKENLWNWLLHQTTFLISLAVLLLLLLYGLYRLIKGTRNRKKKVPGKRSGRRPPGAGGTVSKKKTGMKPAGGKAASGNPRGTGNPARKPSGVAKRPAGLKAGSAGKPSGVAKRPAGLKADPARKPSGVAKRPAGLKADSAGKPSGVAKRPAGLKADSARKPSGVAKRPAGLKADSAGKPSPGQPGRRPKPTGKKSE